MVMGSIPVGDAPTATKDFEAARQRGQSTTHRIKMRTTYLSLKYINIVSTSEIGVVGRSRFFDFLFHE